MNLYFVGSKNQIKIYALQAKLHNEICFVL